MKTWKVVPFPSSLATWRKPPWLLTIARAVERSDFRAELRVQTLGCFREFVLTHRAEGQRLVHLHHRMQMLDVRERIG